PYPSPPRGEGGKSAPRLPFHAPRPGGAALCRFPGALIIRSGSGRSPTGPGLPGRSDMVLSVRRAGGRFTAVGGGRATGIVCHPDGQRWVTTDGPRPDREFASLARAEEWCRELRPRRPDLECWARDEAGRLVSVCR